jgi:hypothetical protein
MSKRVRVEEEGEDNNVDDDGDRAWTLYQVPPIRSIVDSSLGGIRNLLRFLSASRMGEATVEETLRAAIRRDIVQALDWSRRPPGKPDNRPPSWECTNMEMCLFGMGSFGRTNCLYPSNFMHNWDFKAAASTANARLHRFNKLALVDFYRKVFNGLVVFACIALQKFVRVINHVSGAQQLRIVVWDGPRRVLTLRFQGGMIEADIDVDDTPFARALADFMTVFEDRTDDSDDTNSLDQDPWLQAFARLLFDLLYNRSPRCALAFDAVTPQPQQLGPEEDNWDVDEDLPPPFPGGTLSLASNGQLARPGKTGGIVYSNVYS